ncbi:helix-turn-helix domain-containing protein [Lactobacillus sp. B4007]|nr:helix-turn-helix domain-containing protein [Lactobacillus sp. B4007]
MTNQERIIAAEHDYELGVKYKDIAEKYGVSYNTVKSWRSRQLVLCMQLTFKPNGQQIKFECANDPRKIKSQTFRQGFSKFKHFEEVTE